MGFDHKADFNSSDLIGRIQIGSWNRNRNRINLSARQRTSLESIKRLERADQLPSIFISIESLVFFRPLASRSHSFQRRFPTPKRGEDEVQGEEEEGKRVILSDRGRCVAQSAAFELARPIDRSTGRAGGRTTANKRRIELASQWSCASSSRARGLIDSFSLVVCIALWAWDLCYGGRQSERKATQKRDYRV